MEVIENFSALSVEEQLKFAEALVKTLNSEATFIDGVSLSVKKVEADDMTGGLIIEVSHDPKIEVARNADWTCDSEEETDADPGYDADYENSAAEDAEQAFKALSTKIEGYTVSLSVEDTDEEEFLDTRVDKISHEDDGIGSYEYFGFTGYDSQPYIQVEGAVVQALVCDIVLFVEPDDVTEVDPEE